MKIVKYLGLILMYAGLVLIASNWYPWIRFWMLTIPGIGMILLGLLLATVKMAKKRIRTPTERPDA